MQLLSYILFAAAALSLHAVTSNAVHHNRPSGAAFCHFNGHIVDGACNCTLENITGHRCTKLKTTICDANGNCPDRHYCLYKNIDCLYRHDCLDRRGWCLPLDRHV